MFDKLAGENDQISNFVYCLSNMPDHRDNRGKKKNSYQWS